MSMMSARQPGAGLAGAGSSVGGALRRSEPSVRPAGSDGPARGRSGTGLWAASKGTGSRGRSPARGRLARPLALHVAAALLLAVAAVGADIDVYFYTGANQSTATVVAGGTLDLYTYLDATEGVGGMFYSVECPDASWSLSSRDYASYGWYHDDGLFDNSTPVPGDSAFPVPITSDMFFGFDPTVADFSLNTSRDPVGSTFTIGTIETFSLIVPTAPGTYVLDFGILDALDGLGGALLGEVGHSFTVTVVNPVPEPSGVLLLGLAVAGAACRRRPRRCV